MSIENALDELMPEFEPRGGGWDDVLRRARRTRRRYGLAAVAVAALLVVPAALGLHGLFQGTPAPPAVKSWFADSLTRQGFRTKFPQADVSQAHGVLEVQTSDGPEDLWVAPNDRGGSCWFIDFANDPPGPDGQYGFGGCYPWADFALGRSQKGAYAMIWPSGRPSTDIDWGAVWINPHPTLQTLWGHLNVSATRVEVDLANGSTLHLSVVESFFLASLSKDDRVTEIRAYDEAGARVATVRPLQRKR
jgi:hypothetical protein